VKLSEWSKRQRNESPVRSLIRRPAQIAWKISVMSSMKMRAGKIDGRIVLGIA
jgi:hypothetical protein